MPSFTPPTYKGALAPEPGIFKRFSLWRFYNYRDVGYHVLITSGVATPSPGRVGPQSSEIDAADAGSGENGKAWFRGGITYTITAGEDTILQAAGYTTTP